MKVLLLVAHGSRKEGANEEVVRLAERVAELGAGDFDRIVPAFLEFAEPDIHKGIDYCVELGADEVVVVPYFLAAGNHVLRDIPSELACVGQKYPQLSIRTGAHIGASEVMGELVLCNAQTAARAAPVA